MTAVLHHIHLKRNTVPRRARIGMLRGAVETLGWLVPAVFALGLMVSGAKAQSAHRETRAMFPNVEWFGYTNFGFGSDGTPQFVHLEDRTDLVRIVIYRRRLKPGKSLLDSAADPGEMLHDMHLAIWCDRPEYEHLGSRSFEPPGILLLSRATASDQPTVPIVRGTLVWSFREMFC